MKKITLIFLIFILTFFTTSCRDEKLKNIALQHNQDRAEKSKYLQIYNVTHESFKGKENYILKVNFYVNNSSDKTIYWFQVNLDVFSGGVLTHSIIHTPNYYSRKNSTIKYYHTLAPKQTGHFQITLEENYKILSPPDKINITVYEVGDNIDVFKKIRVNPDKYFTPYIEGE